MGMVAITTPERTRARPVFSTEPLDYEGLHHRYLSLMGDGLTLASEDSVDAELRKRIEQSFEGMMSALYRETGASLRIGILAEPEAQEFIEVHAGVLDSSFQKVEMSGLMRRRLQRSDYIFSGMKAFHEMNEAFPSLIDENGNRKSFERFLNDVRKIDKTYNSNYLRAEYNFVQASAEMAGKWEGFMQDGDRYYLQYRTARDGRCARNTRPSWSNPADNGYLLGGVLSAQRVGMPLYRRAGAEIQASGHSAR